MEVRLLGFVCGSGQWLEKTLPGFGLELLCFLSKRRLNDRGPVEVYPFCFLCSGFRDSTEVCALYFWIGVVVAIRRVAGLIVPPGKLPDVPSGELLIERRTIGVCWGTVCCCSSSAWWFVAVIICRCGVVEKEVRFTIWFRWPRENSSDATNLNQIYTVLPTRFQILSFFWLSTTVQIPGYLLVCVKPWDSQNRGVVNRFRISSPLRVLTCNQLEDRPGSNEKRGRKNRTPSQEGRQST